CTTTRASRAHAGGALPRPSASAATPGSARSRPRRLPGDVVGIDLAAGRGLRVAVGLRLAVAEVEHHAGLARVQLAGDEALDRVARDPVVAVGRGAQDQPAGVLAGDAPLGHAVVALVEAARFALGTVDLALERSTALQRLLERLGGASLG